MWPKLWTMQKIFLMVDVRWKKRQKPLSYFSYKNMFMSANYSHESLHFKLVQWFNTQASHSPRFHELESLATKSQGHAVLFAPLIKKGKNEKNLVIFILNRALRISRRHSRRPPSKILLMFLEIKERGKRWDHLYVFVQSLVYKASIRKTFNHSSACFH